MPSSRIKLRISARYLAPAVLVLVLAGAGACSSVWDDVGGFFEDDEANNRALTQSGEGEDFPRLSDVPDTPRPASSPEELNQLVEGLVADRDEARYTNETLRSRYADDALGDGERLVAAAETAPREAPDPAEFADQSSVSALQTTITSSSSGIEPASEVVLGEERRAEQPPEYLTSTTREATTYSSAELAESRQTVRQAEISETRVASMQPSPESGVMPISQFRALFNERFDSSGSSTYRQGSAQQVVAQVSQISPDSAISPSSAETVRAQTPEPFVAPVDGGGQAAVSFQAASIPFSIGSTALSSSDRTALKQVAKLHNKFGGIVRVIGHASQRTRDMDSAEHRWVNFQLSLDRATAVSMELTRLGVPAEAMMVIARADNEPLTYEYMPEGEAENRRADVYIEY